MCIANVNIMELCFTYITNFGEKTVESIVFRTLHCINEG